MSLVIQLSLLALFPVIVSIGFYLLNKFTKFNNIKKNIKQVIYGLVFGILAILGTEFGVDLGGATANARDASVLIAGLVFGAPAGLIAGVIGGVERWFAVFWGAGEYTRLACSLSTILAGVIGAVLRKYMFDNKLPSWPYALAIGLVTEVLHMLMIFITNMNDIITSFNFVVKCSLPMILVNGLAVMFAVLFITLIGKGKLSLKKNDRAISTQF